VCVLADCLAVGFWLVGRTWLVHFSVDIWWSLLTDASFGSLRLWISEVFNFACLLACFVPIFHLLCPFFDSLWVLTHFMFRLGYRLFGLRVVSSRCLWLCALVVNSLSGLIIFWMLGSYIDSSVGTLIPVLWVPLGFSVIKCTLVLHSGTSGRVIPLFKHHCCANDLCPLIGVVARQNGTLCIRQPSWHDWVLELPELGAKRSFVLFAFLDSD